MATNRAQVEMIEIRARIWALIDRWLTAKQIAEMSGQTVMAVLRILERWRADGLVYRCIDDIEDGGGQHFLWRKLPYQMPTALYDSLAGWDSLELARCWGWYTYPLPKAVVQ